MIDAVLKFTDLATAKADAVAQGYMDGLHTLFNANQVIPDVKVWRVSQDVSGTDGQGNPTVTHTFLTGWFCLISVVSIPNNLKNLAAIQFAYDRDLANARKPCVLKSNLSAPLLADLRFSPVFMGANLPWGQWT